MNYWETTDARTGLVVWRSSGAGIARVLPDVHADLMFWRGGLHIAGYDTVAHDFDRGSAETTYGVRLPPGAVPALLRDTAAQAADLRVPVTPPRLRDGVARLTDETETSQEKARALASVAQLLLADAEPDPEISRSASAVLTHAQAGAKVTTIASELGWSTRRLHRFCLTTFGIPAALLRGLYRFRTAHALLTAGDSPAMVAAQAGYADQAHLTRELKRFALTTPARIHALNSATDTTRRLE
jgi:AraC-like DNA-binding protein